MTYSKKLRDPRWQKVRLKVFERDDWKCRNDECQSPEHTPLAIHHQSYRPGRDPWDYPLTNFLTLCERCHDQKHVLATAEPLVEGNVYEWGQLTALLRFRPEKYLTEREGRIVCACIRTDYNPDAPRILLPGDDADIVTRSEKFAGQTNFIPVFIKAMKAGWKFCGRYRVEAATANTAEIAIHKRCARRDKIPISMVLFLEKEPNPSLKK
jgi:hypothetical protein